MHVPPAIASRALPVAAQQHVVTCIAVPLATVLA